MVMGLFVTIFCIFHDVFGGRPPCGMGQSFLLFIERKTPWCVWLDTFYWSVSSFMGTGPLLPLLIARSTKTSVLMF